MQRPAGINVTPPDQGELIASVIQVKAGEATGNGQITVLQYMAPPGLASPLHIHHDADEAWFILEGELTYVSGEWSEVASPGTFVLVRRGTPHRYTVTGQGAARYLELFTVGGKEQFFAELAQTRDRLGRRLTYAETAALYRKHHVDLVAEPW